MVRIARLPGLALRGARVGVVVFGYGLVFGGAAAVSKVGRGSGRGLRNGDRWVRMLIRLGPSYIKIGQLLSTRRDMLPDAITGPLGRLTDSSPPPPRRRIERAVAQSYADRPWPFKEFNWEPVAT